MLIGLLILWTVLAVFFGTAVIAARFASPTRLSTLLGPEKSATRLDPFFENQDEFARCALGYRQLAIVAFVLTLNAYLADIDVVTVRWLWFWIVCIPWLVIMGVALPTAWARHAGDNFLSKTIGLLDSIRIVSRPFLIVQDFIGEIVRRLAGAPREDDPESDELEREILDAVRHGETRGAVDATETEMIRSVMVLDETSVGEIMTPRTDIVGIAADSEREQVLAVIRKDGHSRIPVYEGTVDHVIGILYARDLLVSDESEFSLREKMRDVTFVPETKDLASLLREFQANRVHIAIVLDEYGGTAGLVTIEDILEELVGEITDEHDEPPIPPIQRIDDRTAEVDARLRVDEINDELELSLPEDDAYDTIGGYVLSKMGRIPRASESFVEGDVRIEVVEAADRVVNRLRIRRLEPVAEG
ncbi:MAG: HlyC/CorC family transporter [Phycisphaerales bacterium]|nr:HlyC/CorC family transporter [Phycisphaerales bacterium]MCB9862807.1 HlyC/CorC family transporter [Phycisphaerales bacterium]